MEKIIHYCWFGGNEKPEIIKRCINSWNKYAPDFKVIEWNEENFDVDICEFTREAYKNKKWAFVSDYCRFYALYKYGGIYLDTDVELLKPITDLPDSFVGWENTHSIASGLIRGCNTGDYICGLMLNAYSKEVFDERNPKTVCQLETEIFKDLGLKQNGKYQVVLNTTVFPKDYFCPIDAITKKINITNNTYSIHHYIGSWNDGKVSFKGRVYNLIYILLGENISHKINMAYRKLTRKGR